MCLLRTSAISFLCMFCVFLLSTETAWVYAQVGPSPTLQEQFNLFSIFEWITILELSVCARNSPKTPLEDRLQKVEENVFGKGNIHPTDKLENRIKALLDSVVPANDLLEDVARDAAVQPNWSMAKASTGDWLSTPFQIVSALEIEVAGKLSLDQLLIERVAELEKLLLPPEKQNLTQLTLAQRIDQLIPVMLPNPEKWDIAKKKAGLGGNDIAFLGSLGRGTKKVKKSVGNAVTPVRNVFKSPTFWGVLIGSAAVVGLVYALRNSGDGSDPEHGCHGDRDCRVCKNCRYCMHCNNLKAPCGVLIKRRMMGL